MESVTINQSDISTDVFEKIRPEIEDGLDKCIEKDTYFKHNKTLLKAVEVSYIVMSNNEKKSYTKRWDYLSSFSWKQFFMDTFYAAIWGIGADNDSEYYSRKIALEWIKSAHDKLFESEPSLRGNQLLECTFKVDVVHMSTFLRHPKYEEICHHTF